MKDSIRSNFIRKLLRLGRLQRRILLAFAGLVVALTTYALMTPAITLESEYLCGKEAHVHGPSCYEADAETGELTLICDKEEHIHDERCIVHDKNPERYICGHDYEHVHNENCYRNGELICTLVEHTHTENCLDFQYRTWSSGSSVPDAGDEDEEALVAAAESEAGETAPEEADANTPESGEPVLTADAVETVPDETGEDAEGTLPGEGELRRALPEGTETADEAEDEAVRALPEGTETTEEDEAEGEGEDEVEAAGLEDIDSSTRAGGTKSTNPDESTAVNIQSMPRVHVTFTIQKLDKDGNVVDNIVYTDPSEIDTSLIDGANTDNAGLNRYNFTWEVTGPATGAYSMRTGTVYYYDLDLKGGGLYMADTNGKLKEITEFYKQNADGTYTVVPNSGGNQSKVVRNGDTYRFYLFNPNKIINSDKKYGYIGGPGAPKAWGVDKSDGVWDVSKLCYHYVITGTLPRALDDFNHYYFLLDNNTVSSATSEGVTTPLSYSGFVMNKDNLVVTLNGQTIKPLSQAGDGDSFAYYLEESTGRLYFFNRSNHTSHEVDLLSNLKSGWCLCWQQTQNLPFTVTYDDVYGRPYVLNNRYRNDVYLCDENFVQSDPTDFSTAISHADGKGENRSSLLVKEYHPTNPDHTYEITFKMDDDPSQTTGSPPSDLVLRDTMQNAMLKSGTRPKVYWKAPNSSTENLLTEGSGYTLSILSSRSGFTVTVPSPQRGVYVVRYEVELIDPQNEDMVNKAGVGFSGDVFTGMEREITPSYSGSGGGGSGGSGFFFIRLIKKYEGDNPLAGATFAVYDDAATSWTGTDDLIAYSVVDSSPDANGKYWRRIDDGTGYPDDRPIEYVPGSNTDIVSFNADYLELDHVYYIVETEAPQHYQLNPQKVYFLVSMDDNPVVPAGNYNPADVTVLDGSMWPSGGDLDYTFQIPIENPKFHYTFPETGSSAGLLLRMTGVVLILSPALLLLNQKRNKKQANPATQPELH